MVVIMVMSTTWIRRYFTAQIIFVRHLSYFVFCHTERKNPQNLENTALVYSPFLKKESSSSQKNVFISFKGTVVPDWVRQKVFRVERVFLGREPLMVLTIFDYWINPGLCEEIDRKLFIYAENNRMISRVVSLFSIGCQLYLWNFSTSRCHIWRHGWKCTQRVFTFIRTFYKVSPLLC
jgi:hypothetical protein